MPAESAIHAVVAALDLTLHKRRKTWFLLAGADAGRVDALVKVGGPRLDLVEDSRGSDVLQSLQLAGVKPAASAPCDAGPRVRLSVYGAPAGHALAAVEVATGQTVTVGAPSCAPLAGGERVSATDRLIAVVEHGTGGAALFRSENGMLIAVRDGDKTPLGRLKVGSGSVQLLGSSGYVPLGGPVDPPNRLEPRGPSLRQRLPAATVIGPTERLALFEEANGGALAIRIRTDGHEQIQYCDPSVLRWARPGSCCTCPAGRHRSMPAL